MKKLDARFLLECFIGYAEQIKSYELLNASSNILIVPRDVTFEETGKNGSMRKLSGMDCDMDHISDKTAMSLYPSFHLGDPDETFGEGQSYSVCFSISFSYGVGLFSAGFISIN